MSTPSFTALAALSLLALAPAAATADTPAPNDGMRWVSLGAQADDHHDQQALAALSLPVGRRAWVQAGVGQSRSTSASGTRRPGIVTGGVGVAGEAMQLTVNAAHRGAGSGYRQTDVGAALDWRQGGNNAGVDVTHRRSQATGTDAASPGTPGAPVQARVAGTGVGLHGGLQVGEHVVVYASAMRSHYRSSTRQADPAAPGGLLGSNPVLARMLLGGVSAVNRDEAAMDRSAQVGATYRWTKVAVSGEYTTGQLHDNAGALRSVELKAAIDVAPGWRVAPGVGRGTSEQGGNATFASLAATYGW